MTTHTSAQPSSRSTENRVQEVGGTLQEQGSQVAGTAKEQVKDVAAEATNQARGLAGELKTQVRQQTDTQRGRLVEVIREFSGELERMAENSESAPAAKVVQEAASRLRSVETYLDNDPDVAGDVRNFARRRPGAFVLAAATAGVVAGRLTRGAREARKTGSSSTSGQYTGGEYAGTTVSDTPIYDEAFGTAPAVYGATATGTQVGATSGAFVDPPPATPVTDAGYVDTNDPLATDAEYSATEYTSTDYTGTDPSAREARP
jgi:hypothetical protein